MDDHIREQLEAKIRSEMEPGFRTLLETRARENLLSDDEWLEDRFRVFGERAIPEGMVEVMKAGMLAERRRQMETSVEDDHEVVVKMRIDRLLPILERILPVPRPMFLAESDYYKASQLASEAELTQMLEAAEARDTVGMDPKKKAIRDQLLQNLKVDMVDMKRLRDPDITEADLTEVSVQITKRFEDLTNMITPPEEQPPE